MNLPHSRMDLGPRPRADCSDGNGWPMLFEIGQT